MPLRGLGLSVKTIYVSTVTLGGTRRRENSNIVPPQVAPFIALRLGPQ